MSISSTTQVTVDITTIVVTFNNEGEIIPCLESLFTASKGMSIQLIIVDNASKDGTRKVIKDYLKKFSDNFKIVDFISNDQNIGFTKAVNQGLAQRLGRFVLLLNPDVVLESTTILHLTAHLNKTSNVGMVAPQLLYPDGRIQPSSRRFPKHRDVLFELFGLGRLFPQSRFFNGWKMGDFNHKYTREVDQPQGAFLLARSSVVDVVGNLDSRFTMFFSDVDWCKRFKQSGWKILFCAETHAIHKKGTSVYNNRARMIVLSHRDFITYFRKYYLGTIQSLSNALVGLLLLIILLPRLLFLEIR